MLFYKSADRNYDGSRSHTWNNETSNAYQDSSLAASWDNGPQISGIEPNYGAYWLLNLRAGVGSKITDCAHFIIYIGTDEAGKELDGSDQKLRLGTKEVSKFSRMGWIFSGVASVFAYPMMSLGAQFSDSAVQWLDRNTLVWNASAGVVVSLALEFGGVVYLLSALLSVIFAHVNIDEYKLLLVIVFLGVNISFFLCAACGYLASCKKFVHSAPRIYMTFRSCSLLLHISILWGGLLAGWSAQATVISPSGLGFLDLGQTTVDQTTGLEWLDLTETRGRSLQDVMTDLTDAGGQFNSQDRWRVATKLDFRSLMSNWLGVSYLGYHYDTKVPTAGFIRLFGDNMKAILDADNSWADIADGGAGYTTGMLADEFTYWGIPTHRSLAIVLDRNLVNRKSRQQIENYTDYINDYGWADLNDAKRGVGVYLYREYKPSSNTVPTPAPWILALFGMTFIGWQRRRQG